MEKCSAFARRPVDRAEFLDHLHWLVQSMQSVAVACACCRCCWHRVAFAADSICRSVNVDLAEAFARCSLVVAACGALGIDDGFREAVPSNAGPTNAPNLPYWKSIANPCTKRFRHCVMGYSPDCRFARWPNCNDSIDC